MPYFNIVAETNQNTVVTEYEPVKARSESYESEAALEKEFIRMLGEQGYQYLPIHSEAELIANLRERLEELNKYQFSDTEWERFFNSCIANPNEHIVEKTAKIQEDYVQVLKRDDSMTKNITLIDRNNIHNNRLQVINQYVLGKEDGATYDNRYDVTILVNGLPLVHVELKRRGVPIREAFNQIERYQRDSFWAGSGLFEYMQIFVISNGTNTKYYSNSTRSNAIKDANSRNTKKGKTSNSFEFTSFWADSNNRVIPDLIDFTKTFFAKHTLLNILTKYCVFTSENMLMVMRPYQITATERILNRIEIAHNYKKYGDIAAGGYIWHTTGSGKTLTSFKTARLATQLPFIDKVLFVVDRKDLDYQTMKEYDRFEKGAANSNSSTAILERQLRDPKAHIIITTIQKLSTFIKKNKEHEIYKRQIVIIFDECHRSQFGDMHDAIVKSFKQYYMFGFTGTPIFPANAGARVNPKYFTTEQTFGDQLHAYTIVDAINDKNVLPFRVDYIKTMDTDADIDDEEVWDIDRKKAFEAPERISLVASYILNHFDQKTYESVDGRPMPGYVDMIEDLTTKFPLSEPQIVGEQNQKDFIALFGVILRMRNLLVSFDEFMEKELLTERDLQDYLGRYQDLRDEWKRKRENGESTDITDDIVFEIELIKQIEINIDYILMLVKKYHDSHGEDKEILVTINKAVDASPELRSKKALIESFIAGVNDIDDVMDVWHEYVIEMKEKDLVIIIEEEHLKPDETREFMDKSFQDGELKTIGTDIDRIMPPVSRFGGSGRAKKKEALIRRLMAYFEKFRGLV